MRGIELLAPAKNIECGIAAVNSGADAVYIGAPKFGLRMAVTNNISDLEKLINYAHKYWVKVYITVNSIMTSNQKIEEAAELIRTLYNIGADGIIIRDLGLLEFDLPPIRLIASTQAHCNTWEKVKFMEEVGISKVVLPRELTLDEIREIRNKTNNIELEAFIHGFTCAGYSGLCSLDYSRVINSIANDKNKGLIEKRCANIGSCTLPCRRIKYSLKDSSGKYLAQNDYLLRHNDLNLTNYIEDLIDAGITSFKIEGRVQDASYVKNVVAHYRKEFDKILDKKSLKKSSSGKSLIDFTPNPAKTSYKKTMNVFTDFYIKGRKKEKAHNLIIGTKLGAITEFSDHSLKLASKVNINVGDAIFFKEEEDKFCETTVTESKSDGWIVVDKPVNPLANADAFRSFDKEFADLLENTQLQRKVFLNLQLSLNNNELNLSGTDEDGNIVTITSNIANNMTDIVNLNKVCLKLPENSIYSVKTCRTNIPKDFEINQTLWNQIISDFVQQLDELRRKNYPKIEKEITRNSFPYPAENISYQEGIYNDYSRAFYDRHGVKNIEAGIDADIELINPDINYLEVRATARRVNLDLQNKTIMKLKYCLKNEFDLCKKRDNNANDFEESLYLVDEDLNITYKLNFDCQKCEMDIIYL